MPGFKRLEVHTKSTDFRKATKLVEEAALPTASAGNVVVKNHYVGINATDVNITNGAYTGPLPPPFGCGLDAGTLVTNVALVMGVMLTSCRSCAFQLEKLSKSAKECPTLLWAKLSATEVRPLAL